MIGTLLALIGLGAALLAAARALRSPDPLVCAVTAAALGGFAYWMVHGSFDWFWEFAGLGAPAFALLGLACALAPRVPARSTHKADQLAKTSGLSGLWRFPGPPRLGIGVGAIVAVLAALSLTAPWLSQLEVQSAARVWRSAPQSAYARLRTPPT